MLRVLKSSGRVHSSANGKSTANSKGLVELSLQTHAGTKEPVLNLTEKVNYGKVRWSTSVNITREEVEMLVSRAQSWLEGKVEETLTALPETVQQRDVEVTPEDKSTFEMVNSND